MMTNPIVGNSIIISGASRGLGAAIAKEACKRGFFYFGVTKYNELDITNYSEIDKFIDEFHDYYIKYKVIPFALINNAGICIPEGIFNININNVLEQFKVNVFGAINLCKAYSKLCKELYFKGKILNIASTAAFRNRPGRAIYAATKAALVSFSLSLSEELKPYNIKVYTIAPGAFDSQLRKDIAPDDDFNNMLKPVEIAKFILDIIEDGKFLDNQVIFTRR